MSWWQSLLVALAGGAVTAGAALYGVIYTARVTRENVRVTVEKTVASQDHATAIQEAAARRRDWWEQFSWAAQLCLETDPTKQETGLRMMPELGKSELLSTSELRLLYAFARLHLPDSVDIREDEDVDES